MLRRNGLKLRKDRYGAQKGWIWLRRNGLKLRKDGYGLEGMS